MTARRSRARIAGVVLVCTFTLFLAACSHSSPSTGGADGTALPTATPRLPAPGDVLDRRVHALLAAPAVSVDEDLQTDGAEQEVRLAWSTNGAVVNATTLPVGSSNRTGTEVFRSPSELLERQGGTADACWSQGAAAAARFDRPVAQEISVLRSARATSGEGSLLKGSVSARALLGLLGSDPQLQDRGLTAPAGARVPAAFGTTGDALEITAAWAALMRATGSTRSASGTWLLRFRPFGTTGPTAPSADMMCA
jgi:hypothetical protein